MQLQVKGKNSTSLPTSSATRSGRSASWTKLLADPTPVVVELAVERNPSIANNQIAEATIWTKGPVLRAREASTDMKASIDQLADKLERQVERYRDKRHRRAPPRGLALEGNGVALVRSIRSRAGWPPGITGLSRQREWDAVTDGRRRRECPATRWTSSRWPTEG